MTEGSTIADNIQNQLRAEFEKCGISYAPKQEGTRKKRSISIIELDKVTQFLASHEQSYLIQAINNKSELFDEPYQKIFKQGIKARTVYLAWLIGSLADLARQERLKALKAKEALIYSADLFPLRGHAERIGLN